MRREKTMKKILFAAILVILAISMFPMVSSTAEDPLTMDVMMFREEFGFDLNAEGMGTENALDHVTPFWVDMVDAEALGNDGEGVYIAVLDTGLLDTETPWWQFFFSEANIATELGIGFTHDLWWDDGLQIGPLRNDRGFLTKAFEGSGHGTHVVSTIVGYHYSGSSGNFWVDGVAPKATIIPVLVLDAWIVDTPMGPITLTGGTDPMVAAGIEYIANLAETLDGPVIISMSLGGPEPSPLIEAAIDHAISEGVVVVASAGNEGYDGMGWPGAYPQVISCAMAGWTEQWFVGFWYDDVPEELNTPDYWGNNWQIYLDEMSSRPNMALGQKSFHLDVTTPGAAILGPYKSYFSDFVAYYYLWGTSMAAPHVSGIAALVKESYPHLAAIEMEHILKAAAAQLPIPSDGSWVFDPWYGLWHFEWFGNDWGRGFLQAFTALSTAAHYRHRFPE
jgi:subtilisin family serine protease